jgi:Transcriptional regulatory protein, C terminal
MIYRFEQFEVDDREFRFCEHGEPLQVEPKVLRLLLYLIENRSRLVRKQELLDTVWQDAMVTENHGARWPASAWGALTRCRATPPKPEPHIQDSLTIWKDADPDLLS